MNGKQGKPSMASLGLHAVALGAAFAAGYLFHKGTGPKLAVSNTHTSSVAGCPDSLASSDIIQSSTHTNIHTDRQAPQPVNSNVTESTGFQPSPSGAAIKVSEPVELPRKSGDVKSSDYDSLSSTSHHPRRLRRCETVLAGRTSQLLLVLEHGHDLCNQKAILRSAECMGIQHVWLVRNSSKPMKNEVGAKNDSRIDKANKAVTLRNNNISKQATSWLSLRTFETTDECIKALKEDKRQIWVTELSQASESLGSSDLVLPDRVALVMGRELDGVSATMIAAADKLVYLPMYGWSESFNLSVATALCIQRLFAICPTAHGEMDVNERQGLRDKWYAKLAKTPKQRVEYAAYINTPPPAFVDVRRPEALRKEIYIVKKNRKQLKCRDV